MAPGPAPTTDPDRASARAQRVGRLRTALAALIVLMACAGVFWLYLRPELAVDLANRLWSCF